MTAIEVVIVKKKVRPHPGPLPQEREISRALEEFVNSMAVHPPIPLFTRDTVTTCGKWENF
jgi:hypothetical protein